MLVRMKRISILILNFGAIFSLLFLPFANNNETKTNSILIKENIKNIGSELNPPNFLLILSILILLATLLFSYKKSYVKLGIITIVLTLGIAIIIFMYWLFSELEGFKLGIASPVALISLVVSICLCFTMKKRKAINV